VTETQRHMWVEAKGNMVESKSRQEAGGNQDSSMAKRPEVIYFIMTKKRHQVIIIMSFSSDKSSLELTK